MSVVDTSKSFVEVAKDRNITLLAAGVTYYAFVSIVPLLILTLALTSVFGGQEMIASLLDRVRAFSPAMADMLQRTLSGQTGQVGASLGGTAVLVWSAIKVFRGIDVAFDEIYESFPDDGLLEQVKKALIVIAAVVVAAVLIGGIAVAVNVVLSQGIPFPNLVSALVLLVSLPLLLLPIYYVMPPIEVSLDHVIPGTVLASVGLVALQWAFVYYLSNAGKYQAYGVLGAILLFVTWLYFAAILLLAGAVLNLIFDFPSGNIPSAEIVSSD